MSDKGVSTSQAFFERLGKTSAVAEIKAHRGKGGFVRVEYVAELFSKDLVAGSSAAVEAVSGGASSDMPSQERAGHSPADGADSATVCDRFPQMNSIVPHFDEAAIPYIALDQDWSASPGLTPDLQDENDEREEFGGYVSGSTLGEEVDGTHFSN